MPTWFRFATYGVAAAGLGFWLGIRAAQHTLWVSGDASYAAALEAFKKGDAVEALVDAGYAAAVRPEEYGPYYLLARIIRDSEKRPLVTELLHRSLAAIDATGNPSRSMTLIRPEIEGAFERIPEIAENHPAAP